MTLISPRCGFEQWTGTSAGFMSLSVSVTSGATLSATITTSSGLYRVSWGDGTTSDVASGSAASHTYSSAYSGPVTFTCLIATAKLTRFSSSAAGWAFGLSSMPASLTYFNCAGSNTISGDLSTLPAGLASFNCAGSNTISGNLSSLSSVMTYFGCTGNNTISGDLSTVPNSVTTVWCSSSYDTVTFTGSTWSRPSTDTILVKGASGWSSSVTDALLNAFAASATTWTGSKIVTIKGTRSSASDASVTTLQGKGVTVTVATS